MAVPMGPPTFVGVVGVVVEPKAFRTGEGVSSVDGSVGKVGSAAVVTLISENMQISWDPRRLGKNTLRTCRPTRTSEHGWLFFLNRSSRCLGVHGEEGQ